MFACLKRKYMLFKFFIQKYKLFLTDIDLGGILALIKLNAKYNARLMRSQFKIMQLDFKEAWSKELSSEIEETDVFIAADGKHRKTQIS